jgi:hypothetical protein
MDQDSTGKPIAAALSCHSLAIAYNADGTVNTITSTDPSNSANIYVCTFGYTNGSPVTVSGWVKQ